MASISKEEAKNLKKVGKLLEKRYNAKRESEKELASLMTPILDRMKLNNDLDGLNELIELIPKCSTNGQFVYRAIYELINVDK